MGAIAQGRSPVFAGNSLSKVEGMAVKPGEYAAKCYLIVTEKPRAPEATTITKWFAQGIVESSYRS